jgi:sodium-dependent dicarboxylate transporter 2/3/5
MKTVGLLAGPACALLIYLVNPGDHPAEGRRMLAVLVLAILFWATEAIPLPATALLASALCIVLGVAPVREVLAPYSNPIIFLFVGTFLMAEAFKKYGLDRRVAARLLGHGRFARSRIGRILGVGAASGIISTCLSNTASAALMTPIAIGATRDSGASVDRGAATASSGAPIPSWASGVLLMVAWGASIGGMATLIGTPPNLLVAGFLEDLCGVRVGFVDWLLFGVPIALVLFAFSVLWTRLVLARDRGGSGAARRAARPGPRARRSSIPPTRGRRRWERGGRWRPSCWPPFSGLSPRSPGSSWGAPRIWRLS